MFDWVKKFFSSSNSSNSEVISTDESSDKILSLETQLQELKLELKEKEKTLNNLQQQLNLQEQKESKQLDEQIASEKEKLFNQIASPVSQLITQKYLLEVEAKEIKAEDILLVVKRLLNVFENEGLNFIGAVGEATQFDPNYHQSLNSNVEINTEDTVVIKIVGISYQNQVIKKAIVEKLSM